MTGKWIESTNLYGGKRKNFPEKKEGRIFHDYEYKNSAE